MPDDVPLRQQLACAKRELALRLRLYPRLVEAEADDGAGQAELFGEAKEQA